MSLVAPDAPGDLQFLLKFELAPKCAGLMPAPSIKPNLAPNALTDPQPFIMLAAKAIEGGLNELKVRKPVWFPTEDEKV